MIIIFYTCIVLIYIHFRLLLKLLIIKRHLMSYTVIKCDDI